MKRYDPVHEDLEESYDGDYVTYEDAEWWMVQAVELAKALDREIDYSWGFEGDNLTDLLYWAKKHGKLPSEFDPK